MGIDRSEWVALARTRAELGSVIDDPRWKPPPTSMRAGSDDFSGLLPLVQW